MLQLSLAKDGVAPSKLSLNLAKPASFRIDMGWDTAGLDLDVHALLATNNGSGAKVTSLAQVLSTYNCTKTNPKQGTLPAKPDGSFQTPEGALVHSPDEIAGGDGVDEYIIVNGAKVPDGVNEIPIFVTIDEIKAPRATFGQVHSASLTIKDSSGNVIKQYTLSNQFGQFQAVQMGSFVLGDKGWEFMEVAVGFNGDFNTVLGNFS